MTISLPRPSTDFSRRGRSCSSLSVMTQMLNRFICLGNLTLGKYLTRTEWARERAAAFRDLLGTKGQMDHAAADAEPRAFRQQCRTSALAFIKRAVRGIEVFEVNNPF